MNKYVKGLVDGSGLDGIRDAGCVCHLIDPRTKRVDGESRIIDTTDLPLAAMLGALDFYEHHPRYRDEGGHFNAIIKVCRINCDMARRWSDGDPPPYDQQHIFGVVCDLEADEFTLIDASDCPKLH